MFDKETILIIALAGLIIYILMSNKDEYTACVQNSKPVTTFSIPSSSCNPLTDLNCPQYNITKFAENQDMINDTISQVATGVSGPMFGPINHIRHQIVAPQSQFGYPMKFATKGSKMAMN